MLPTHWLISTQDGKRLEPKDIRAALDKDKTLRISSTSAIGSANTRINKLLVEWGKNFHKRRENNPKSVEGDAFAALDLETYIRTEVSWSARQSNFSRRRSISTRTRRLFDSVVMWSRRYRFGRQCPPPKSDESALNETWSSSRWRACRWRAPGPTVRGPQLPICSLCKWPSSPHAVDSREIRRHRRQHQEARRPEHRTQLVDLHTGLPLSTRPTSRRAANSSRTFKPC